MSPLSRSSIRELITSHDSLMCSWRVPEYILRWFGTSLLYLYALFHFYCCSRLYSNGVSTSCARGSDPNIRHNYSSCSYYSICLMYIAWYQMYCIFQSSSFLAHQDISTKQHGGEGADRLKTLRVHARTNPQVSRPPYSDIPPIPEYGVIINKQNMMEK